MGWILLSGHLVFMALTPIQAHEYILTFVSEISFIWNAPWTFPKALFLLSRYWTLVTLIVRFYRKTFQLR